MSTGRAKFNKSKKIMQLIVSVLRIFPKKIIYLFWNSINGWQGIFGIGLRYCILKVLCKECGDNIYIAANVEIKNMEYLSIGDNVSIHRFCYIDAIGGVSIGNNVSIAHSSSIIAFNHTWNDRSIPIKYNPVTKKGVVIEDDVWIGCGVRILDGVKIYERSIVGAGSVVTREVERNSLVAGIPNKLISKI